MVESPQFDDWVESQSREFEDDDLALARKNDKEYATLLTSINEIIGTQVDSYDNLSYIPTKQISDQMPQLAEVISSDGREPAQLYAVSSLLEDREDISFEALRDLFVGLPHDSEDISGARGYVANIINEKLDAAHTEEYLILFESANSMPSDVAVLYQGIHKIKDNESRVNSIIVKGLMDRVTAWGAVDAARRRKAKELLPELRGAVIRFSHDREISRHIERTIKSLEKIAK